ncbi:MAG: hypothetical protein JJE30_14390 [Desulfuromonadales bacterium]|nr:hypothetical protein [Desulfuromonadales bacterium]
MKTNTLKNLVKKARGELSWPAKEVAQESGPLRIFSDPVDRAHTIFLPTARLGKGQDQELLYLHELGHALLCERVHPFFSSGFPIAGLDEGQVLAVSSVLYTASDWFVGHWLMEFCPDVAIAELEKEYEATVVMMEKGEPESIDKFFVAVLIIAQSIKYLKVPVESSGFLDAAIKAFLAVPPEKPSLLKIENLINSLLSLGAPFRCRHKNSEGQDVLEFYRASEE